MSTGTGTIPDIALNFYAQEPLRLKFFTLKAEITVKLYIDIPMNVDGKK
jgi:hypothetical protein